MATTPGSSITATLERLQRNKGVVGVIVLGPEAQIIRSTLDEALAAEYAALLPGLAALARSAVRELDPRDDLEFLRVRGSRHEIMAAPTDEFTLIVIQDPSVTA